MASLLAGSIMELVYIAKEGVSSLLAVDSRARRTNLGDLAEVDVCPGPQQVKLIPCPSQRVQYCTCTYNQDRW